MELVSCRPFGTWNFEVSPRFLETLYAHGLVRIVPRLHAG
jgi:hypothetical protein